MAHWITIGAETGPGDIFSAPFAELGLDPPPFHTTSPSDFGALALVESPGAACTFPQMLLESVRGNWQIMSIPEADPIAPLPRSIMTREGPPLTPATDALASCVRKRAVSMMHG